jgi:outer membrane lipoprotein-sorting protein
MKRIILITAAVLMSMTMAGAQTAAEQKAADLLKKASTKIKAFTTMEVDFTYVMENTQMGIKETMNGKVFSKGDKYRMTVGDNVFISDGKSVWNYIDDLSEIHINTIENTEGGLSPTALLNDFETQYQAKFIKQETHNGKLVDIIDLVPNAPQSFFKYRMALEASNQNLIYTTAFDRHGGTYTYTIVTLKPNLPVAENKFQFNRSDFPASADVIDMR